MDEDTLYELEHRGQKGVVVEDEENDGHYLGGQVLDVEGDVLSFEGGSAREVEENFINAVDDYLDS